MRSNIRRRFLWDLFDGEWTRAVLPAPMEAAKRQSATPSRWEVSGAVSPRPEILAPESMDAESLRPDTIDPESWPAAWRLGAMAGRSLGMQHLFARMRHIAPHFRLATLEGEAGTGKLLAAQTLHRIGPAGGGPFVPCMAGEFLDSAAGLWEEARGGLLWLSHIEDLTADQQRRMRDFLERAAHERIRYGANSSPLQIVAGSAQSLRRLAAAGSFRSDLASHLTAIRFALPPLRERRDDIPLLAALFLRRWIQEQGRLLRGFGPGTLARLGAYDWPGNVRELESVVTAAAVDCPAQWIRPMDLPRLEWPASGGQPGEVESADAIDDPNLDRLILRHVTRVLARVSGNKVRAARLLGISRSTLYRLLESSSRLSSES